MNLENNITFWKNVPAVLGLLYASILIHKYDSKIWGMFWKFYLLYTVLQGFFFKE